jgi:flagellar protein FliO/FliZ
MRIRHALSAAVLGLLILAPAAYAQDGEATPLRLDDANAGATEAAGSGGGSLVRTIVGLAVVIGVIYGLHWVLKQVKASREQRVSGSGLRPIATLPLGANRSLHLVRAGGEVVLVGVGDSGVTPVRTYSEEEARALGLLVDDDADPRAVVRSGAEQAFAPRRSLLERLRDRTVIR